MPRVSYSRQAEQDLLHIATYTLGTWGEAQSDRYLADLRKVCEQLAERPLLGRSAEQIHKGLRRLEQGRHVIFYMVTKDGIKVTRFLHQQMEPIAKMR